MIIPPKENSEKKYQHHAHRMQAGVAYMMNYDEEPTTPKHLRVGVNSAHVNSAALAELLIELGIIELDHYLAKLADVMEKEADDYEARINQTLGTDNIKLGSLYKNEEF